MSNLAPTLSSDSDDRFTPLSVLELIEDAAGVISVDPFPRAWDIREHGDGFDMQWRSRSVTFCNPPYSRLKDFVGAWAAEHPRESDGCTWHLVGLVPARPDTQWFKMLRRHSDVVCFWDGRIKFERAGKPSTSAPFPSVLFYSGPTPGRFCDVMEAAGHWPIRVTQ